MADPRPGDTKLDRNLEQQIREEIQSKDQGDVGSFLNNFFCKLPGTTTRDYLERPSSGLHSVEVVDQRRAMRPSENGGFSEKFMQKTRAEFLEDVSLAIKNSRVSEQELKAYVDGYPANQTTTLTEQLMLPVYVELRRMGYSHRDLYTS